MVCNLDFNESNWGSGDQTQFDVRTSQWTYRIPSNGGYEAGREGAHYGFVPYTPRFQIGEGKFKLNEAYVSEHRLTPHDRTKDYGARWKMYERLAQDLARGKG